MDTIRKKKGTLRKAILPMLICILIGWLIFMAASFLFGRSTFPEIAKDLIKGRFQSFDERAENIRDIEQYGKATNELLIQNVASAYNGYDFAEALDLSIYSQSDELKELFDGSDVRAIHIVSPGGKIYLTTEPFDLQIGSSIVVSGVLTQQQFDQLKQTAEEMDMKAIMRADMHSDEHDYQEPLVVDDRRGHKEFYAAVSTGKLTNIYKAPDNNYVIMECSGQAEDSFRTMLNDLSTYFLVDDPEGGITSFLVNTDTGIVTYGSKDHAALIGEIASVHGIPMTEIRNRDGLKQLTIDGKRTYVYTARYRSKELGNYALVCQYYPGMNKTLLPLTAVMVLITAAAVIILVSGITMEETDLSAVSKKLAGMIVLALLLVDAAAFYFSTNSSISWAMNYSPHVADALVQGTLETAEDGEEVKEFYERRLVSIARSTRAFLERVEAYAIEDSEEHTRYHYLLDDAGKSEFLPDVFGHPASVTKKSAILEGLCYMGAYDMVYILDANGRAVATSGEDWRFDVTSGRHTYDAEVLKVLHREKEYHYEMAEGEGSGKGTTIAVPLSLYVSDDRENGKTVYHNRADFENDTTGEIKKKDGVLLIMNQVDNTLVTGLRASAYSTLLAVESTGYATAALISAEQPHRCLDYHDLPEAEIASYGFSEEQYLHDSYKFVTNENGRIFASLMNSRELNEQNDLKENGGVRLLIMFDREDMFNDRMFNVLIFEIISVLLCGFAFVIVLKAKKKEQMLLAQKSPEERLERTEEERKYDAKAGVVIKKESGTTAKLIRICFYGAAMILISITAATRTGEKGSFFAYILSKQWDEGLNIFSVSYILYLMVIIAAILMATRRVVESISSGLSPAAETVVRLILSVIQYAGIMILAFYSMKLLGVQMGTVITFGGIITGVIGLGANSLISDIIAGLFIIFEREFRVNDIVTIDGFTGVVRGIGLRTTRVQDSGGNVKTFNNSKIVNVLNLTENYSTAFATVNVSLEVPVDHVEQLVNAELPKRMAENRDIVEGPWFSGIIEIKNGYYTISVGARCEQRQQWTVKKELTKHLLQLLKENEIRIS